MSVPSGIANFRFPGLTAPLECLVRFRSLVWQMVRKEILTRYRGSLLGVLWSLVTPLLFLAMYTFAFGLVLEARWGAGGQSRAEFAVILFAGLVVFWLKDEGDAWARRTEIRRA